MLCPPRVHLLSLPMILGFCIASASVIAVESRSAPGAYGDRRPSEYLVYPAEAFHHQGHGGRILDVTKPPFNAKGDGVTDDTQALIAAYDMVADAIREPHWQQNSSSYIIYLPKGVYLVSDTIIHSPPRVAKYNQRGWGGVSRVRFIGESRDETIIRLKDDCPGFEAGKNKRVLSFQRDPGTNVPGENICCNLTVNTGRGNPGAIGIMFHSANLGGMRNITIRSEDGAGAVGLDFALFSMQGHCRDITIEGFDYGIRVVPYAECNPTLEYVSLTGQSKAGIRVEDGSPCIRKLWSRNAVPAVHMVKTRQPAAQTVLIDSLLEGGSSRVPAIQVDTAKAQLFARNVKITGYDASIELEGTSVAHDPIAEYVSGKVFTLFDSEPAQSLALSVEEAPLVRRDQDARRWANVDEAGGDTSEQKIQAALNSGASSVCFPSHGYEFREVSVPASVRHIDFLFSRPRGGSIVIDQPSDEPLWVENFTGRARLILRVPRTLVMRNCRHLSYDVQHNQPNQVFLENCVDVGSSPNACGPGVKVWARCINNENKNVPNFRVHGGTMWVLGYKTEGHQPSFEVCDGGYCEVLGGYRNETTPDEGLPIIVNDDSNVSYVGYSSMSRIYAQAVEETRRDETRSLASEQLPVRARNDVFVPLYVGGQPDETDQGNEPVASGSPLNVLMITADDLNWDSCGCYGCLVPEITPHIDSLAKTGMRFEHAYLATTVCVPSRQSMLTGRYPHSSGTVAPSLRVRYQSKPGIENVTTVLQEAGYFTCILGKSSHHRPVEAFHWDLAYSHDRDDFEDLAWGKDPNLFRERVQEAIGEARKAGKPFFIQANVIDPHRPFANSGAEQRSYEAQCRIAAERGESPPPNCYQRLPDPSRSYTVDEIVVPDYLPDTPEVRQEFCEYFDSVKRCDDSVGAILGTLQANGLNDNTIVLFLSDNGMPFPGAKSRVYQHGARTPLIVVWPGTVAPGTVDNQHFVNSIDLAPTLLDALSLPKLVTAEGRSFLPLLKGRALDGFNWTVSEYCQHPRPGKQPFHQRAVFDEDYVYIYNHWSGRRKSPRGFHAGAPWQYKAISTENIARANAAEAENPGSWLPSAVADCIAPSEELYRLSDVHSLNSLADDEAHAQTLADHRRRLLGWMERHADPIRPDFKSQFGEAKTQESILP